MKRKLLLVVMLLCITQISNAQTIDLIGVGIKGNNISNLTFTDTQSIDSVQVGAIFSGNARANASLLFFDGALETPVTNFWDDTMLINQSIIPARDFKGSYFTATFTNVDNSGVNANVVEASKNDFHSFFAFVHRNAQNATYKSYVSDETVWFYENGSNDAYVYNVPINTASTERNVKIKVPITELANDSRTVVVDITAGDKTLHIEESVYNLGDSFFLGEYAIEGVAGTVDAILVSVYSPDPNAGEDSGDSFFVNGVVADVDIVEEDPGCTLTQGYWKTHSKYDGDKYDKTWAEVGEDSNFYLSGKSYYKTLKKLSRGNKYYNLAHQFIATKLNFLNGADPTDAKEAFDKAVTLFERYTPSQIANLKHNRSKRAKRLKRKFVKLAKTLDEYNNGIIGPGHCDEDEAEENPCLTKDDVIVTPNPVVNHGTVKFTPTHEGRTVVYMYNSYGQFVCPLYDKNVAEGQEVDFTFNARYYKSGTYYLKIWSGCCVVVKRIVIHCY